STCDDGHEERAGRSRNGRRKQVGHATESKSGECPGQWQDHTNGSRRPRALGPRLFGEATRERRPECERNAEPCQKCCRDEDPPPRLEERGNERGVGGHAQRWVERGLYDGP